MSDSSDDVIIRREGRAGRITLNRPKVLNSLTLDMVRKIHPVLTAWASDAAVAVVVLDGSGDRALCAGGDVISLYNARGEGSGAARAFWREEYALNACIHRYPKPFVPIMHGIVMGGGIGLSAHAQGGTRVVTEKARIAFPETTIGLIPDVGGTWLLARAPAETGIYLGLLGAHMSAADALYTGFADLLVESERVPALIASLASDARPVPDIIRDFARTAPASALAEELREPIAEAFSAATVAGIAAALQRLGTPWAQKALADFAIRSPTAMKTTLAAIRRTRGLANLEEALAQEFLLCTNLYEDGEFTEGVRALLVDKDKAPKWRPASLGEVTEDRVTSMFAPLADGDRLTLPSPPGR